MTYILAIDLGTSGPKVAIMNTNGDIIAQTRRETSMKLPPAAVQNKTRPNGGKQSTTPRANCCATTTSQPAPSKPSA
ncbi:MAG: hypothetical protein M9930_22460 [Anaerolineae bacterium]|nr:hypothetical protein [Anaerolineae bacterium]